jgi:hypothetical protein
MAPALKQPGLLGGRPRTREIGDELAEPPRLQAGEDTLAHVPGTDTPQITRYAPDALSRTKSLAYVHLCLGKSNRSATRHRLASFLPELWVSLLSIQPSHGLRPFSIHGGLPSRWCVLDRTSG